MLKLNEHSVFDLLSYFEGRALADGVFEDRFGREKRRFTVSLTGEWRDGSLVLDEDFLFDDGERQHRTWTLRRTSTRRFTGRCEDSVADADGRLEAGRATLRSDLRLRVGSRLVPMRFSDVFYELGGGLVLNRSTVSKWGVRLGQGLILFRKG